MPRIDPNARTNVLKPRKVRKAKPAPTRAPVTDVQSSGGKRGYGGSTKSAVREQARRVRMTHKSDHASDQNRQPTAIPKNERARVNKDGTGTLTVETGPRKGLVVSSEQYKRLGATGVGSRRTISARTGAQKVKEDSLVAPALKILNETTRPVHAIAAGSDAALTGKDVKKAVVRGLQNKDKTTFGTVLKHAGAPKVVQGAGGFALDVGLDPTTYLTFGTGSVVKKAALDAAEKQTAKGVVVKLAGRELPGVRRATATAGSGAKTAGRQAARLPGGKRVVRVAEGAKEQVRAVRPTMAPAGADKEAFTSGRQVARKARATTNRTAAVAERQARGLRSRLDKIHKAHGTTDEQVAHALDTNDVTHLPPAARKEVQDIHDQFARMKKERAAAGVVEGHVTDGYFPHAREDALHAKQGIVASDAAQVAGAGTKRTGPALASSKGRKDLRPIRESNPERVAEGKSKFSTDVPLVYVNYAKDTGRAVAEHTAFRELAATGRAYHEGDLLKPSESVFRLGHEGDKFGLRPFKEGEKVAAGDKLVVLDTKTVDTALARMKPARAETAPGRLFDKATGGFKGLAVATPGFHVRNAIGDTQMAYLSQPGHKLIGNTRKAMKVNKLAVQTAKADRRSLANLVPDTGGKIKVAGGKMDTAEVLRLAEEHGVVNAGQVSRELRDLVEGGGGQSKVKHAAGPVVRAVGQKAVGRENVTRLSTFIHGLDQGMSPAKAADLSLETHIDYGDLTEFERKFARRAMPFYTFNARALPFHAKKLVTNPGKFANYEKLREELAAQFGGNSEGDQTEFQQRAAGLAFGNGKVASFGLPLTLLNELPAGKDPVAYATELGNYAMGMANPIPKDALELLNNYSFFYRSEIRRPTGPLVAAPVWAKALPDSIKKKVGYTDSYVDKKSGKKVPGWDAYANYVVKAVPGPVNLANQLLAPGKNQQGRGAPEKAASGLLGIKVDAIDPESAAMIRLYATRAKVTEKQAALRQQGIGAGDKAYDALSAQTKAIGTQIGELSKSRGDVIPAGVSRVRKVKKSSGSDWGGSSSSSGGGGDPWGGSSSSKSSSDDPWG